MPAIGVHGVPPIVTVLSVYGVAKPLPLRLSVHIVAVWFVTLAEVSSGVRALVYV